MCYFSLIPSFNKWPTKRANHIKEELKAMRPSIPFPFILCTEVLISFLNKLEAKRRIVGLRIARTSRMILPILFADDSLFRLLERTAKRSDHT